MHKKIVVFTTRAGGMLVTWLLLAAVAPSHGADPSGAATWYVRMDGGSAAQCTGRADAPYPGSGANQACAWSHPFVALPPSGTPRIAGGDTLMIGPGSYQMGLGAPDGADNCSADGPSACHMPPVPSGPSASQPTRILGQGYDSGCHAAPELWGSGGVATVLNLAGSNNVQLACLEVTDHSACIEGHSDASVRCPSGTPPLGPWAENGLTASNSRNVLLQDLNIHGLATQGILAGGLADWTLERVKIRANGWAGWNGDIGGGSSNAGKIVMRDVEVAWNGCAEKYPGTAIYACWGQQAGGYGDGLGTAKTGGNWIFEGGHFHHNTQDGLDLLYADGTGSVTVRGLRSDSNAGNQVKVSGPAVIENSVLVGNCAALAGTGILDADLCRANGNALVLQPLNDAQVSVRYNVISGQGDCLVVSHLGSSSSRIELHDNVLAGTASWPALQWSPPVARNTCLYYWLPPDSGEPSKGTPQVSYADNLIWQVKDDVCPDDSRCGDDAATRDCLLKALTDASSAALIDEARRRCHFMPPSADQAARMR